MGPEAVTYGQLIDRIRDQMLLDRPTLNIPILSMTPLASRVSALITGEEHALIGPLMVDMAHELVTEVLSVRPHRLDAAIERALRDWELSEPIRGR